MGWSSPSSLHQLLPVSNILIACGSVVTNPAEPTDQLKTDLAKTHFFHQVSSQIHPARAQGNRARGGDTGGQGLLLLATSACAGCGGAAFDVLQNLKDSVDRIGGV